MTDALERELSERLRGIRSGHDVAPFMAAMHPVDGLGWRPLPDDMLRILVDADDYRPVVPGGDPTWFDLSGPDSAFTLVIYRASIDEQFYVLAPAIGRAD